MRFSIVTVSFNQRQYLQEAMDSVLSQDYPDLEYIVVDPGSTDGSRELIEEYSGRIANVILDPDRGAADGLNAGFNRASGEVFGFLNSDDALLPGAIRQVAEFLERNSHCDMVFGDGYIVGADGLRRHHIRARGFTPLRYFYGAATWLQQATFFRRGAFERVGGFNVDNRSCWDGELFVEMALQGARIGYLHRDLAHFRVHAQSITGSRRHKQMMRADAERMFRRVCGRAWDARDAVRARLFRIERLLTHPGALRNALEARVHRT